MLKVVSSFVMFLSLAAQAQVDKYYSQLNSSHSAFQIDKANKVFDYTTVCRLSRYNKKFDDLAIKVSGSFKAIKINDFDYPSYMSEDFKITYVNKPAGLSAKFIFENTKEMCDETYNLLSYLEALKPVRKFQFSAYSKEAIWLNKLDKNNEINFTMIVGVTKLKPGQSLPDFNKIAEFDFINHIINKIILGYHQIFVVGGGGGSTNDIGVGSFTWSGGNNEGAGDFNKFSALMGSVGADLFKKGSNSKYNTCREQAEAYNKAPNRYSNITTRNDKYASHAFYSCVADILGRKDGNLFYYDSSFESEFDYLD